MFRFFDSSDDFGEFRVIFGILQVFGIAPYLIGKDVEHSRRSKFLVTYNIIIATFVLWNMFVAEKDPKNDLEYPNKTFLVDVAYDFVDVLGNIYVSFVTIKATIHTETGIIVWFKLKAINVRLKDLNIVFDYKKLKYYMFFKIGLLTTVSTMFLASDVILNVSMGLYYTINYWITALFPLLFSVVVGIIFGSCTLCLYQRYWVVNEFIRRNIADYAEKVDQRSRTKFTGRKIYNEKILENVIFENRNISIVQNWKNKVQTQPKEFAKKPLKSPTLLMLKNYPACFFKREPNFVKDMRLLRDIHYQLYETTLDLNTLFGAHFVFIFTTYFFGCTINLYFAITFHLRAFQNEQYASAVLWAIVYFFLILYLITYSNIASNEAKRTTTLVQMFLNKVEFCDSELQTELQSFSFQLLQCPVQFKASGFFSLDSPLLFQFIAGVMSNLVFVIQFDKLNFSQA